MKFKAGDNVLITAGKDKGQQGKIVRVIPGKNRVVVAGVNMYTRHIKPSGGQSGDMVRRERPLPVANIAIINDKGQPDRIGYQVAKDGTKERIFKKTGKAVPEPKTATEEKKK